MNKLRPKHKCFYCVLCNKEWEFSEAGLRLARSHEHFKAIKTNGKETPFWSYIHLSNEIDRLNQWFESDKETRKKLAYQWELPFSRVRFKARKEEKKVTKSSSIKKKVINKKNRAKDIDLFN